MRSTGTLLPLTLVVGASARALSVARRDACSFDLLARGGILGDLGESMKGNVTIGGENPETSFYIQDGKLVDVSTGACEITSESQLLCDGTASAETWTVSDNTKLANDGATQYFACEDVGDGSLSIFTDGRTDHSTCYAIDLYALAYNCTALGGSTSSTPATSSSAPASGPSNNVTVAASLNVRTGTKRATPSCPTDISGGTYTSPNLIVPVSAKNSNTTYGSQANVTITPDVTSLFNFDIDYAGTCALVFLFPYSSSLAPGHPAYLFSGVEEEDGEHGGLNFTTLGNSFNTGVSYATKPSEVSSFGKTEIIPGNTYTIGPFDCTIGNMAFEASSVGNVDLIYTQSEEDSPLGLYVVPCFE